MNDLKDILVNVGAIAGFAGIVGLAVLAMLYFSQARDVRRLRDWAGREPERAAEVEVRAQQIAGQAIAQAYESMAMRQSEANAAQAIAEEHGVEVADPVVAVGGFVPASEIVGEEGSTEIADPDAAVPVAGEVAEDGSPVESEDGELGEDAAAEATPEIASDEEAGVQGGPGDTMIHPPPNADEPAEAAVAGDVNDLRPSRLAPSTPAAARAGVPLPPLPPLDTSEFSSINRPPTPTIPPDYYTSTENTGAGYYETVLRDEPPAPNRPSRVPFAVAGVLVAIFAVVLIATQIGGGNNNTGSGSSAKKATPQKQTSTAPKSPKVNRPAVSVVVLNGTQTSGLAKLVGDQLIQSGFTETTTGNRNDGQPHPKTIVYYAGDNKLEAQEVAKELNVKNPVQEIDASTQAAGGASAAVVVVVGADLDQ